MLVPELFDELEGFDQESEVFIEINGTVYKLQYLYADSQGLYLVADSLLEEEELRGHEE